MLVRSCRRHSARWLAAALFVVGFSRPLFAQTTIVRLGAIDPGSRASVLGELQRHSDRPDSTGLVFCVTKQSVERRATPRVAGRDAGVDSVFLVMGVERATIDSARSATLPGLRCGNAVPWIRDRAARACATADSCAPPLESSCAPTAADYLELLRTMAPYAAIHCGEGRLRFFFAAQFVDASGSWSIERRPAADPQARQRRVIDDGTYVALLFAGVWANGVFRIDADAGGYRDEWSLDKYTHGLAAGLLTFGAMTAGVKPTPAAVGLCAAGAAFEVTQGYISSRDIVADCTGALSAWLWYRLWVR